MEKKHLDAYMVFVALKHQKKSAEEARYIVHQNINEAFEGFRAHFSALLVDCVRGLRDRPRRHFFLVCISSLRVTSVESKRHCSVTNSAKDTRDATFLLRTECDDEKKGLVKMTLHKDLVSIAELVIYWVNIPKLMEIAAASIANVGGCLEDPSYTLLVTRILACERMLKGIFVRA